MSGYAIASCPPWDSVIGTSSSSFGNDGFLAVSAEQLVKAFHFYDNDPNIDACRRIRMDSMLNGGFILKRSVNSQEASGELQIFITQHLTQFSNQWYRNRCAAGFVAYTWKPHPRFMGTPVILDLTLVDVEIRTDIFGQIEYRYWDTRDHEQVLLDNVTTVTYDAPSPNGCLRSLIGKLHADFAHEMTMQAFELIAMKNRAMPVLLTTIQRQPHDPSEVKHIVSELTKISSNSKTKATNSEVATTNIRNFPMNYQHSAQITDDSSSAVAEILSTLMSLPFYSKSVELPEGRLTASTSLPEGPGELLLKFRLARQERTFTAMGVPIAMLSRESTPAGPSKNSSSNKSGTSSHAALNTFMLFQNSQQALKTDLTTVLSNVMRSIYEQASIAAYLRDTPTNKVNLQDAESAVSSLTVQIPSVPDQEIVIRLYENGWLAYEQLVAYLSHLNGIPLESFNKEPEITVPEANGIMPPEPPAKKSKK